jgi:hypothetical protein
MFDESDDGQNQNKPKPIRNPNGTFQKGTSCPNPRGWSSEDRLAHKDLKEAARRYTGKALRTLVNILDNNKAPASAKASAAAEILNRGWGRTPVMDGEQPVGEITVRWLAPGENPDNDPAGDRARALFNGNGPVIDHNG